MFGSLTFAAGVAGPYYASKVFNAGDKKDLTAVDIDLSKLEQQKEEEKKIDIPPPPPPPEEKPPEVAQVKFLPPEPKPDEEVKQEEPPPKQEETEKAQISNVTKEGAEVDEIAPPPPAVIEKPAEIEKPREEEVFTIVEQNPEFPGGNGEMYKFLGKNIKYPSAAQRANVSGRVFLTFVVNTDGSIVDVNVVKGIGFGCDEEALRVVKTMPKWNPGKQSGRNVRVKYTIPVTFQLE
jgi:protein TonB